MSSGKTVLKERPYIRYIKRLCALEDRRMEGRLLRAYRRLHERVVLWLSGKGPATLEDAEDVSSKAWTEILVAVRSRQYREWNDAIVYTVAWHRFLDHAIGQRNRVRLLQKYTIKVVDQTDIDTDILIPSLVASLPGDERAVIENVYLDGYTLAETASELKMSVSSVKRLQSRALTWMRSQVG
jgi:RNA polymerase sigma factor (sigma-70 family)